MKCRIRNNQPGPRVYYDTRNKPVTVNPGRQVVVDLDEATYSDALALDKAGIGPEIELVGGQPEPRRAPPKPQPQPEPQEPDEPEEEDEPDEDDDEDDDEDAESVEEEEPEQPKRRAPARSRRAPARRRK